MQTYTFIAIGWYLLIGVLVHLFVPKPPRAKEAFEMGEKMHPAMPLISMTLVALFWPLVIFGTIRRWIRKLRKP